MDVKKISDNVYEVARTGKMNVPVRIYASEALLKDMQKDRCIGQMVNVSQLPGIQKYSLVLPDAHLGYGFCIGGVAGFDRKEGGIISPGGVGYDISCSVRLLRTNLKCSDVEGKEEKIAHSLFNAIPSGVGKGTKVKISAEDLKEIMELGSKWAVKKGYGKKEDYEFCEEEGQMKDADAFFVSEKAIARGVNQLGSIGSGNHFLELQYVDEIFDAKVAKVFGLEKDQLVVMIHCGSRGFGHQIASDYIRKMEDEYGSANLPDRQLISAPIDSALGKAYYKAMCAGANFAFCNKQILTHLVRESMGKYFPDFEADVVYDVCHNIAKFEEHKIDGKKKKVCVHRKGATRSFGPGNSEIPKKYRKVGQPVLIPGSMGSSSYVLVGTQEAEEISFSSTAHGAGRVMSRHEAMKTLKKDKVAKNLANKGVVVEAGSVKGLVEEAPEVYKDVEDVVRVSDELNIGKIVARMKPVLVIKG